MNNNVTYFFSMRKFTLSLKNNRQDICILIIFNLINLTFEVATKDTYPSQLDKKEPR